MEEHGQIEQDWENITDFEVPEECLTDTEQPNVVDGVYVRPQVYWIPFDDPDENGTQDFLRFTIQPGCTVEEGKEHLASVVQTVLNMEYDEFMEAFGFTDD